MIGYNITYGNIKLNKELLSENDINLIMKQQFINKKINDNIQRIPTKDISVNKCVIII